MELISACAGERWRIREALYKTLVYGHHLRRLRAVQHYLRHQDIVGVFGQAPGEWSEIHATPGDQGFTESRNIDLVVVNLKLSHRSTPIPGTALAWRVLLCPSVQVVSSA